MNANQGPDGPNVSRLLGQKLAPTHPRGGVDSRQIHPIPVERPGLDSDETSFSGQDVLNRVAKKSHLKEEPEKILLSKVNRSGTEFLTPPPPNPAASVKSTTQGGSSKLSLTQTPSPQPPAVRSGP